MELAVDTRPHLPAEITSAAAGLKLAHTFQILDAGRYLGTLFAYETDNGLRFSHSLLNHASALFETTQAATDDFYDTKARLPDSVHRVIFGVEG